MSQDHYYPESSMKAVETRVHTGARGYGTAWARDVFCPSYCLGGASRGRAVFAHFKGNAKQRRIARRSYIRFAKSTCKARGIPLYINGYPQ